MVVLELFIGSSLYTAGGVVKYFNDSEKLRRQLRLTETGNGGGVKKFVEASVETVEQDPPIFLNTGGNHPGLLVPFGGGPRTEMKTRLTAIVCDDPKDTRYHWTITDFTGTSCAVPKRFWLNTADDLKNYFESNGIPQTIAPLSLPMQVREIEMPATRPHVYGTSEYAVAGTNLERVVRAAIRPRTIGSGRFAAAATLATATGIILWLDWCDQKRWRPDGALERTLEGRRSF